MSRWPSVRNATSAGMTPKLTTTPATDLTCCAAAAVEANTMASRSAVKENNFMHSAYAFPRPTN